MVAMRRAFSAVKAACFARICRDKPQCSNFISIPRPSKRWQRNYAVRPWGIAIAAVGGGMKVPESAAWVIVGSAIIWAILQCAAFALESIKSEEKDTK